jgi:Lar family restriction alleviation protein
MTTELKPCPFCGEKMLSADQIREFRNGFDRPVSWQFSCGNQACGAKTEFYVKDRDMAIATWNKQAEQGEKI